MALVVVRKALVIQSSFIVASPIHPGFEVPAATAKAPECEEILITVIESLSELISCCNISSNCESRPESSSAKVGAENGPVNSGY